MTGEVRQATKCRTCTTPGPSSHLSLFSNCRDSKPCSALFSSNVHAWLRACKPPERPRVDFPCCVPLSAAAIYMQWCLPWLPTERISRLVLLNTGLPPHILFREYGLANALLVAIWQLAVMLAGRYVQVTTASQRNNDSCLVLLFFKALQGRPRRAVRPQS